MIIPGVVLAAGRSSRMGRPKALLPADTAGETFVGRIVRTLRAGGVDDIVVVVGGVAPEITRILTKEARPPRAVINPAPERGQFSSLQVGLRAVSRPGVSAVLVTLVDVPLVTAATVEALLDAYRQTGAPLVRPETPGSARAPGNFRPLDIRRDQSCAGRLQREDHRRGASGRCGVGPDRRGRALSRHRHPGGICANI